MNNEEKNINEGYQPSVNVKQSRYQPKPDGKFGYQPTNKTNTPPSPPKSGSNAVKKKD